MTQLAFSIAAPPPRKMPAEPIMRSADIENGYRWTMTRGWGSGPSLVWTLLNPSTADGKVDDPTTLRMMGFSYRWGFGSMIVTNIYPFISSTTDKLRAWRKTFDHKTYEANGMRSWDFDKTSWSAFHHNQSVISKLIAGDTVCVAAWGAGVDSADLEHFHRGVSFPSEDEEFGTIQIDPEWKCLGRTADRSPIHPLARCKHRVPDDAQLKVWKKSQALEPEKDDY